MAKWPRLTLQQSLKEIFMGSPSEHNDDYPQEGYSDSAKYSPELGEAVPNEMTYTLNEPVHSTSNQRFSFHRLGRAGLCGGSGRIPGSFALLLCHFLNITFK